MVYSLVKGHWSLWECQTVVPEGRFRGLAAGTLRPGCPNPTSTDPRT